MAGAFVVQYAPAMKGLEQEKKRMDREPFTRAQLEKMRKADIVELYLRLQALEQSSERLIEADKRLLESNKALIETQHQAIELSKRIIAFYKNR